MSHAHEQANHGSVKSYIVGFVLSVILTAIPFWMVMGGAFTKQATLIGIFALAVVQIIVHLKYFLHLDFSKEGKLNTFSFLFTGMVIVLLVGLSIWIIYTADALMMR
ncbi:cytochrome o ubiquinol oxidase subunit IV [Chromobacterium sp. ATCC 53434]|uniref:cytochrome o ubiquinol oxidase subunit IV n=1 Tax=Chromobacterium TaxID=535 RepID=UPI000C783B8D|nr:cytochrome o ubiquinol oxidase subunit IV [Chromobacterium sp. ATCC 53434]AUH52513.1 cytochrome o ubiquinol oxidase subunit IV [Chromobacterium sp. ATCC 53434]